MKRLLNTLYITTQGAYLHREGETVMVTLNGEVKLKIPVHTLQGIVCFGQVTMSPPLMGLCAERNVLVSFLSQNGRFLARVQGPVSGNVILRKEQYKRAEQEESALKIARAIVISKINNCRVVLMRALREHPDIPNAKVLKESSDHLFEILKSIGNISSLQSLRGIEGEATRKYFEVFDHLILSQKEDFVFRERNRRPPLDNVNALLSFLYTILEHDVSSALETVGLDPESGFFHTDRSGRRSLALDLMEEFRAYLVDRLVLSLINLKQISGDGFIKTETGAVLMNDDTRKKVLVSYQNRKSEEITHPFLNEKIEIGLLPYAQALILARYLRGDINGYPPFMWK